MEGKKMSDLYAKSDWKDKTKKMRYKYWYHETTGSRWISPSIKSIPCDYISHNLGSAAVRLFLARSALMLGFNRCLQLI